MIGKNLIILILAFAVVFAAGGVVENVRKRVEKPATPDSWLGFQLGLSQQQRDQMRKIFADAMKQSGGADQRHELQRQRDDAIRALVPAGKQALYDQVLADYAANLAAMDQKRREVFQQAQHEIEATVLSPEQATKFEELVGKREGHHHGPGDGFGGGPSTAPLNTGPTTEPAAN
jgi:Spy/CpxP family protein refolding chaperone